MLSFHDNTSLGHKIFHFFDSNIISTANIPPKLLGPVSWTTIADLITAHPASLLPMVHSLPWSLGDLCKVQMRSCLFSALNPPLNFHDN